MSLKPVSSVSDEVDFCVNKTEPTNDWRKGDTNETQNHDRGKGCSLVAVGDEFTHGQTITGVDTTRETDQDLERFSKPPFRLR